MDGLGYVVQVPSPANCKVGRNQEGSSQSPFKTVFPYTNRPATLGLQHLPTLSLHGTATIYCAPGHNMPTDTHMLLLSSCTDTNWALVSPLTAW